MQLIQPNVQKCTTTTRPLRSFIGRGFVLIHSSSPSNSGAGTRSATGWSPRIIVTGSRTPTPAARSSAAASHFRMVHLRRKGRRSVPGVPVVTTLRPEVGRALIGETDRADALDVLDAVLQ